MEGTLRWIRSIVRVLPQFLGPFWTHVWSTAAKTMFQSRERSLDLDLCLSLHQPDSISFQLENILSSLIIGSCVQSCKKENEAAG